MVGLLRLRGLSRHTADTDMCPDASLSGQGPGPDGVAVLAVGRASVRRRGADRLWRAAL